MEQILEKLKKKENLTFKESKSAFELLMTGKASEDEIYNLDADTIYFMVNILNQTKLINFRNKILNVALPIRS